MSIRGRPLSHTMATVGMVAGAVLAVVVAIQLWPDLGAWQLPARIAVTAFAAIGTAGATTLAFAIAGGMIDAVIGVFRRPTRK